MHHFAAICRPCAMVPLTEAAQDNDVLFLILDQGLLDGGWLQLARTCRQWCLSVYNRWGAVRLLSREPTLLIGAPPEGPRSPAPPGLNNGVEDDDLGKMMIHLSQYGDEYARRFVASVIRNNAALNARQRDRLLTKLGLPLSPPVIQHPTCIAWVGDSLCVVEDHEQAAQISSPGLPGRVSIFSTSGERQQMLNAERYGGEWLGRSVLHCPYQGPQAAVSDGSALYIAQHNQQGGSLNALYKLSLPELSLVNSFDDNSFLVDPTEEDEEEQVWDIRLGAPSALVVVGPSLYVLDRGGESGDASVSIFSSSDLQFQSKFGAAADGRRHGSGEGELCSPEDMVEFKGELFVADTCNNRVQVFSLAGTFVRSIGDGLYAEHEPFDSHVPPRGALDTPVGLCIFRERLVVAEHHQQARSGRERCGRLTVFCVDGTPLQRLELPFLPSRLCANGERLFCCDYCGHRVYTIQAL